MLPDDFITVIQFIPKIRLLENPFEVQVWTYMPATLRLFPEKDRTQIEMSDKALEPFAWGGRSGTKNGGRPWTSRTIVDRLNFVQSGQRRTNSVLKGLLLRPKIIASHLKVAMVRGPSMRRLPFSEESFYIGYLWYTSH